MQGNTWGLDGWSFKSSLDGEPRSGESVAKLNAAATAEAGALVDKAREAARAAKASKCPRVGAVSWAWDQGTLRAYAIPCGSWRCSWCGWRKRGAAAFMLAEGMAAAHEKGQRVRFVTLTEDSARPLETVADVSKCWNRFRTRLKRAEVLDQYALAIEMTQAGRPHIHAVTTGEYVPQKTLSEHAAAAGFGPVADIRAVKMNGSANDERTAGYIAKELAGYVSKTAAAGSELSGQRLRPVRTSRQWYPGGLRRAEAVITDRYRPDDCDSGPDFWHVFSRDLNALVKVSLRDDLGPVELLQGSPGRSATIRRFRNNGGAKRSAGEDVARSEKTSRPDRKGHRKAA